MSVPFTIHAVVSYGATRALAGGVGLGAAQPLIVAMVTGVVFVRFTKPASGSVPTLTDQRSTPQVGLTTDSVIVPDVVRVWASATLTGIGFAPVAASGGTVAKNEKTLSPAVTSPWVASS